MITPAAGAAPSAGNPARRHTPRRAHICVPRDIPDQRVSNKHTIYCTAVYTSFHTVLHRDGDVSPCEASLFAF